MSEKEKENQSEKEKENQEVHELINELRATVESKNAEAADSKEKVEKINAKLDEFEEKNAKLVKDLQEQAKKELELKEALEKLEKTVYRSPNGVVQKEAKEKLEAFYKYLKLGNKNLTPEEAKYLRTDVDPDGGYLCPYDYVTEIIKKITEVSPIRSIARVRTTSRESVMIPKRETLVKGQWVGEGGAIGESNSTYGMEEIKTHKLSVFTDVTVEMLRDSAFSISAEIDADIVESFAETEGEAFVSGDGVAKPEGILENSSIQTINSGVANNITADSIIEIEGEVKAGYNPIYLLNRRTLAKIRQMKDGVGQYLWVSGLAAGQPNTLNGLPYLSTINIPDIAPDAIPVILGDFMKGYVIVDNTQLFMLRDDYTQAAAGKVRFVAWKRVGGQVVLPEAIKFLKAAV